MPQRVSRFRGRGISQSQRRKKVWGNFRAAFSTAGVVSNLLEFDIPVGVASPSPQSASVGFVFPTTEGGGTISAESTLLRIRGSLNLDKTVVNAGPTAAVRAFGIGVMESTAAALGAFPNPATPEGAGWDGWMFYRDTLIIPVDPEGAIVDVKSMRKIQSGYSLFFAYGIHQVSADDTDTTLQATEATFVARGLFLLP